MVFLVRIDLLRIRSASSLHSTWVATHGSRPWEASGKPMWRAKHVHYQKSGRDLRNLSPEWLITGCWTALVLKIRERDKLFTRDFRELDKLLYDLIWNARDCTWDLKQEPQKKNVCGRLGSLPNTACFMRLCVELPNSKRPWAMAFSLALNLKRKQHQTFLNWLCLLATYPLKNLLAPW